jgi:two-component sensor histidine kinase
VDAAGCALVKLLQHDNPDVPFVILYSVAGDSANLSLCVGIEASLAPQSVTRGENDLWAIGRALTGESLVAVDHPPGRPLPGGGWPEPACQHVAMALPGSISSGPPLGVLVIGANPRLRLNDNYLDFLRLVRMQVAGCLAAIGSVEREVATAKVNELLVHELQHRSRNLISVIQAISAQTMKTSSSLKVFQRSFENRLAALGRAQGLLARSGDHVPLEQLIALELDILNETDRTRVFVEGSQVLLPRDAAQLISLALHELMTNAIKHGALKEPSGSLRLSWATDADCRELRLVWEERLHMHQQFRKERVPRGFGRTLIEQALPARLGGRTELVFQPTGVRCTLMLPN